MQNEGFRRTEEGTGHAAHSASTTIRSLRNIATNGVANRPKCLLKSTNMFLTVLGYFWRIITGKGHFGPFLRPKKGDSGAKYLIF